ncbi:MAG: tRNA uridine-5-carboxymethylaminomethyl(34) synthesis GTPase MnmE [Candidatus Omnitrophica bacterium]|nr:tRNA uridine-5-carboxymethylaminomethyl(34) synthesis GTPase MnmE [Candidatus Omnitrophota bacterium]
MSRYDQSETIVAIATPPGEGGIGIVRLSGPDAVKIASELFRTKNGQAPLKLKTYTMHYGHIVDGESKDNRAPYRRGNARPTCAVVDEVILTVMRAPGSYTKEDVVEINCHAGIRALERVMELVLKHGARLAAPGEFTRRAFLNGRIDLSQAEAVLDVIRSKTEGSLKVAMGQLEGELSRNVNAILEKVMNITAEVEASIDFPEEGLELPRRQELAEKADSVVKELELLAKSYKNGVVFREGVLAIICGKPNVGKSSLMNLLLKRDRVIVSPIPGTTRDAVEETINLNGVPIRLVDTAGISSAGDALEKEGVRKSKSYLNMSDIAILMFDASTPLDGADRDMLNLVGGKKKIVVLNKIDLAESRVLSGIKNALGDNAVVEISVKDRRNIDALEGAIRDAVLGGGYVQGESAVVSNARHKEALDNAVSAMLSVKRAIGEELSPELVAIDLKEAIFNLGLVIGKSVSDDMLDRIFGQFCIGK